MSFIFILLIVSEFYLLSQTVPELFDFERSGYLQSTLQPKRHVSLVSLKWGLNDRVALTSGHFIFTTKKLYNDAASLHLHKNLMLPSQTQYFFFQWKNPICYSSNLQLVPNNDKQKRKPSTLYFSLFLDTLIYFYSKCKNLILSKDSRSMLTPVPIFSSSTWK